eukprot:TRINITY_DN23722_c0_g1_i1.p2 TRINITY_DN23722_c0_g1~~TRINITY_DN23722_c0_g1_i1.p2  ORF type:complete len:137 (-),score=3.23 TRINITY_DN23722_c0_g1_i1:128-538(-)
MGTAISIWWQSVSQPEITQNDLVLRWSQLSWEEIERFFGAGETGRTHMELLKEVFEWHRNGTGVRTLADQVLFQCPAERWSPLLNDVSIGAWMASGGNQEYLTNMKTKMQGNWLACMSGDWALDSLKQQYPIAFQS